jgi:ATP-dependent helicase/nuclease subunit A
MQARDPIPAPADSVTLLQANTGALFTSPREEMERMARRRHQDPQPKKHGKYWTIVVWKDEFQNGKPKRRQVRVRLASLETKWREVLRLKDEYLRPLNQGLISIGSATNFRTFVQTTYMPLEMPLLAKTTQGRYSGVLDHYLIPTFGQLCLSELTPTTLQRYFSSMSNWKLSGESRDKIRDVLASVLRTAVKKYGLLVTNPIDGIQLPPNRTGKRKTKAFLSPEQFDELVSTMPEPYATMVYVATYSGLRISELIALKWHDLGFDSIAIDERYCRGDFSEPKSSASNATIGVDRSVIERIHRLKLLTVEVKAGLATRKYKLVKSDGPDDLVFQSVRAGLPMRDNNILTRFIKPAGRKLGLGFVNWRCLRTSRATWMIEAGANPKDVQGQMRHSRIQTTLDIYAQFVPDSQRRAIEQTSKMAAGRIANAHAARALAASATMVN